MASNGEQKAVLIKISPETHRELKALADRERRAMGHQAAIAIEEQIARAHEATEKA